MKKTEGPRKEAMAQTRKHWVRLSRSCNNRCIFCLDKKNQDGAAVSLKHIEADLEEGRQSGCRRVVLSGGEPTINPEFLEIVIKAKELGYRHIQVITNGRMFAYQAFLNEAVKGGMVEATFSMHGHNSRLHDKQTQVSGSFLQSLTGLVNALKTKKLIVNMDIVVNKTNIAYLPDILRFFVDLGVREFDLLQVAPLGSAWENRRRLFYDFKKAGNNLRQAFKFSRNKNLRLWADCFPPQYLEGFESLIPEPVKLYDEISGRIGIFERFTKHGEPMYCRGKRCSWCLLNDFCNDIMELKSKSKIDPHKIPYCLKEKNNLKGLKSPLKYSLNGASLNVFDFLKFYIKKRYFIKSLRCRKCIYYNECAGMQCDYIRKYGFKSLAPLNAGSANNG